ncbi:methylenetetrahydrofolate reductase [Paeniglutamicibacter cryotolerans]|uniref:Methylenetetrahydrofolate reductase (NADPH) n=1 Tax=Paeniglutamicibacter cryotolerans TaxID=670079 RepID=A0A839QEB1_9MICC|nr:methylenetetrahydrofolate reductase [Paeniglutamicibacter cryotolerans]MBB2994489.1 methylenetetrahydrofolate reductase (NADPH) [Paeniglutamicibacter cryotolerans]
MTPEHPDPTSGPRRLLSGFSMEMTGKDIPELEAATPNIPPGTPINVTFLGNEDLGMRVAAASAVKAAGFHPVPHISARRLSSATELGEFLDALAKHGASGHVFAVGGDPATPMGPYPDALSLIASGVFEDFGVGTVSIAGYPDGHAEIDDRMLWAALEAKHAALAERGLGGEIITQFGFDTTPVLDWLAELRGRGVDLPVRVGVPGPAGIKRLLGYARRFGVSSSAGIAKRYGFSLSNLLGNAGPERFIQDLARDYDPSLHGEVQLHFYTFGGLEATADWVAGQR